MFTPSSQVFDCDTVGRVMLEGLKSQSEVEDEGDAWKWLRTPPRNTVLRVNTSQMSKEEALDIIDGLVGENRAVAHPTMQEVISIPGRWGWDGSHLAADPCSRAVVVGSGCGVAVLRGAEVFAPGILSAPADMVAGERVAVFADVRNACLKGAKSFSGETYFVGNGVAQISREQLFSGCDAKTWIGIKMEQRIFDCPSLNSADLPSSLMLQNLPSIMAVDHLDPQPGERILDMCAAPGGKTCHIAARLCGKGLVVALDKTKAKVESIRKNCTRQKVDDVVETFAIDATKTLKEECDAGTGVREAENITEEELSNPINGERSSPPLPYPPPTCPPTTCPPPPWPPAQFDRVLLDAPCSALGQRPQFYNPMKEKELCSFSKIQRKLFKTAALHLKPGVRNCSRKIIISSNRWNSGVFNMHLQPS